MSPVNGMLAAPPQLTVLSDLPIGTRATLEHAELDPSDASLVASMGLTDRCELTVCRRGEPCVVRVYATRIGIADSIARRICVRPTHG